jgi:hypothetical protein
MSNAQPITEAELQAARRIIAAAQGTVGTANKKLQRDYHGPVDAENPRGDGAYEFPKMVYKASKVAPVGYITRTVRSQEEQDALPKGWLTTTEEIHALLSPISKAQYVSDEDVEGDEPEEKEHSAKTKQAEKDAAPKTSKKVKEPAEGK